LPRFLLREMKKTEYLSVIESMLFVSNKPLTISKLRSVLGFTAELILGLLTELEEKYKDSGMNVVLTKKGYAFVPNKKYKKYYGKFVKMKRSSLSRQSLEVVAILLKSDATKERIDRLRGVNSTRMLNELLKKGFIARILKNGKIYYGITEKLVAYLPKEAKEKLQTRELFNK